MCETKTKNFTLSQQAAQGAPTFHLWLWHRRPAASHSAGAWLVWLGLHSGPPLRVRDLHSSTFAPCFSGLSEGQNVQAWGFTPASKSRPFPSVTSTSQSCSVTWPPASLPHLQTQMTVRARYPELRNILFCVTLSVDERIQAKSNTSHYPMWRRKITYM